MVRLLHFADAHIDIATTGRRDPETGLPVRALDFLRSLDFIIETALQHQVDLVLFAGDAFKDRHPAPVFQKAWAERILRLVQANIPVVLLLGNHDVSPAWARVHVFELFRVFQVRQVHVIDRLQILSPNDLGVQLYLIGVPWIHRSGLLAYTQQPPRDPRLWQDLVHQVVTQFVEEALERKPPEVPAVLVAHAAVPGAQRGWEARASLDFEFRLPGALLRDPRLDYVALGHIHRFQDLNPQAHPPVVYSGSIQRWTIDEADEEKGVVLVEVEAGRARYQWMPIPHQRRLIRRFVRLESVDGALEQLFTALGPQETLQDAVVQLVVECPPEVDRALRWAEVYRYGQGALEFRVIKRLVHTTRTLLPSDEDLARASPLELLELYWQQLGKTPEEYQPLQQLAREILQGESPPTGGEGDYVPS